MKFHSILPSLCGCLLLLSASTASAATKTVSCSPTKLKILSSTPTLDFSTNSTIFVDVPESTLSFVQGGSVASCVIVRFSAEVSSKDNGLSVRPLLDVSTVALPSSVGFGGMECIPTVGCTTRAHSFEFVFPHVAPGTHLLRMQYNAAFGIADPLYWVHIGKHNTVVLYAN
jgi:hypothetical protein